MHELERPSNRLIADFEVGKRYRFLGDGLQAHGWEIGREDEGCMCFFESGCCLKFEEEENEFIFRSVLLGVTYLFRVHPEEIRDAVCIS